MDRVLEADPPRRCVTLKVFSAGELLLEGAVGVPPSLVIEALCQSAAFLQGGDAPVRGRVASIGEAEITREVRIGDRLLVTATLLEEGTAALKAECRAEVDAKPVARLTVLIARD